MTGENIPRDLEDAISRELEADESLQWVEMPIPRFFTPASTAAFLFAIPWTAFAVFWMFGAAGFKIPDFSKGFAFFPLFGVPFVLIGCFMLASPLLNYRKALKTVYVITNKRAITFEGGWNMTIRSYPPEKLQNVYRQEKRNGSGDVVIAHKEWRDSDGDRQSQELGFMAIRHPKEVEELLKTLAEHHEKS